MENSEINKLEWMNYSTTLYNAQLKCYENHNNSSYDVILVSSDGKQFKSHKIVLSSCSDFFYTILIDVPMEIIPTIYLPDADSTVVECLLSFVYMGESSMGSAHLTKVMDLCKFLEIKAFLTHDFTVDGIPGSTYDDGTPNEIIQQISDAYPEDEFAVEYLDCVDVDDNLSSVADSEIHLDPEDNGNNSYWPRETDEVASKDDVNAEGKHKVKRKGSAYGQLSRNMQSDFDMALGELSKGKTIHQLSIEYNLPRSTLYQKFRSNEMLKQNYRSERRFALEQAVRCVMEERLSLKKASDRYNLPKTAIWRELRKYHHYQPPSKTVSQERQDAQQEILTGRSLTSISIKYNIPLTTLHRDKKRLSAEGKLPEFLRVRDRTENSEYGKRLEQALRKCRQGMSQYQAARIFNIPKATMWRYAHALFKEDTAKISDKNQKIHVAIASENESD